MPVSCFAERLSGFIALTPGERAALDRLEERERVLRRGATLVREKDHGSEMFVLRRGTMMSSVLLDDGSRQILRFMFPGELLAGSTLVYREATETLTALTDCTVSPFERTLLAKVIEEHPRLAAVIMVYSQIERAALTDRLAALGRTSAKARVAAILIDMRNRQRMSNPGLGSSFVLGLTQEEIGDATGLTAVHVNRMLRQLEEEDLIAREAGRMIFKDERALSRAANYINRYAGLDLGWLPPAR
ncbi:Crp/Fnr family transcriptional regulator [Sphingomonas sp. PB4P5]|uniref:Crp/Fnr family transcriptional regulator n=1 Tax=Parasphingomonas puruogangriensis TaxID=3096155 RepID=UPI002FCAAC12